MTAYPVGTVADVTVPGQTRRCVRMKDRWVTPGDPDGKVIAYEDEFESVEPLVVLHLTRDDAADLQGISNYFIPEDHRQGLLRRIAAAIREQVPEPEPPKRWTAQACGHTDATACLVDTQAPQRHEAHHWLVTLDEARRLADLLNEEASRG